MHGAFINIRKFLIKWLFVKAERNSIILLRYCEIRLRDKEEKLS